MVIYMDVLWDVEEVEEVLRKHTAPAKSEMCQITWTQSVTQVKPASKLVRGNREQAQRTRGPLEPSIDF